MNEFAAKTSSRSSFRALSHRKRTASANPRPQAVEVPAWDADKYTLTWRNSILKHFRARAPLQEAILATFHAAGWPPCIAVARIAVPVLPPKSQLRNTVSNLNRSLAPWLRFGLEGGGSRIHWRLGNNLTATRRQENR